MEQYEPSSSMSRRAFLMMALCQCLGLNSFITLPHLAVQNGALGHILTLTVIFLFIGIPLLYMEFVISQFTERDCFDVWKARPCLSHIGYLTVIIQICVVINNHTYNSFLLHYLLVSFESPVPYFSCQRPWTTENCDMLANNYSVREDCLRSSEHFSYCKDFQLTFPEVQYFRYYVIGQNSDQVLFIAWRMLLSSVVICIVVYICNTQERVVPHKAAEFFILVPLIGYSIALLGSMVQKGIVKYFEEALDTDLSIFSTKFRFSSMIQQVVVSLRLGSGVPQTLGSLVCFHAPCYANTVFVVLVNCVVVALSVCTTAMMYCPYAYRFTIPPALVMITDMSNMFEKVPRLLHEYDGNKFWLILSYGSSTMLGMGTNVILISYFMNLSKNKFKTIAKYPGLARLIGLLVLFLITIPLLGLTGLNIVVILRQIILYLSLFVCTGESLVFVIWYGVGKFAEDVHFMQGIKPGCYMKTVWVLSSVLMIYVFCNEIYYWVDSMVKPSDFIALFCLMVCMSAVFVVFLVKIVVAACKKKFSEAFQLDPLWGPPNLILKRSRAMFTAQAMTKEYMYRQHQLQAGVMQRQRLANTRAPNNSQLNALYW